MPPHAPGPARRRNGSQVRGPYLRDRAIKWPKPRGARAWLREAPAKGPPTLGEHDPKATAEIVEDLYARGAPKVDVAEIQVTDSSEWSSVVLVTLPDDPKLRAQVFDFDIDYSSEFDPTEDVGQHCLFLFKFKGRLTRRFQQK